VPKTQNGLQAIDYQSCSNSKCGSWGWVGSTAVDELDRPRMASPGGDLAFAPDFWAS
jgi:hypothetical protein